jgi:acetyltransferase-like isoleucine patch superfamily enzyme
MIQNADRGSCANLTIGNHVYIGPLCLFDLSSCVEIRDKSAISANAKFVTHSDVGHGVLCKIYPRKEGPICIQEGSWVGVGAVVLHCVKVGPMSVVGAMSFVNKDIPERSLAFRIPAKTIKKLLYSNANFSFEKSSIVNQIVANQDIVDAL